MGKIVRRLLSCMMIAAMMVAFMPMAAQLTSADGGQTEYEASAATLSVKNLWASQHDKGRVLFKWSRKDGTTVNSWNLHYRTRKIGGNNKWSGWTTKTVNNAMQAWIPVKTDYVIEIHAQGKGDSTWSTGIITCPAGGKYQAMKTTHVLSNGKRLAETKVAGSDILRTTINLKVGQSISVKPDYDYSVKDFKKRPRLYPTHMLYDVADKSKLTITKPDKSVYTGGIIDGTAAIKAIRVGSTTLIFRSPNGRTMIATVNITGDKTVTDAEKSKYNTYVFFGSDSRANDGSWKQSGVQKGKKSWNVIDKFGSEGTPRSDVIMLLKVDEKNKKIKVVSVLRDTLLDISGNGSNFAKANKAYADGGPYNAIDMLEKNLDIHINGYVSTNFKGMADMIDSLGGVTIDVEDEKIVDAYIKEGKGPKVIDVVNGSITEMNGTYGTDVPLLSKAGKQTLTGLQAVAYSRVRYTEGYDMRRVQRQRTVLKQMISKYKTAGTDKRAAVVKDNYPVINTDLSQNEMKALVDKVSGYAIEDCTFPFYKRFDTIKSAGEDEGGTANVFVPADLAANVTELHSRIYGENWYEPSATVKSYSNSILKAKNVNGAAMNYTFDKRDVTYDNY